MRPVVVAPESLDELSDVIAAEPGLRLIGGGTLEIPRWRTAGLPKVAAYVSQLPELQVRGRHRCGAGLSLTEVGDGVEFPQLLRAAARAAGTPAVRTLATLGGNIVASSPGCLAVALLALEADVWTTALGHHTVRMPLTHFLESCTNPPDQGTRVVTSVSWEQVRRATAIHRATLRYRGGPVMATVAVAAVRRGAEYRWLVGVGGNGAVPQRLHRTEQLLDRGSSSAEAAASAAAEFASAPSASLFQHADYQRHVVGELTKRGVREILADNPKLKARQ
jgi:CO/xanthine dehydrogenase FAD-binding subunit